MPGSSPLRKDRAEHKVIEIQAPTAGTAGQRAHANRIVSVSGTLGHQGMLNELVALRENFTTKPLNVTARPGWVTARQGRRDIKVAWAANQIQHEWRRKKLFEELRSGTDGKRIRERLTAAEVRPPPAALLAIHPARALCPHTRLLTTARLSDERATQLSTAQLTDEQRGVSRQPGQSVLRPSAAGQPHVEPDRGALGARLRPLRRVPRLDPRPAGRLDVVRGQLSLPNASRHLECERLAGLAA